MKVFPADFGGPAYVRAVRQPFGDIPLVPTGGVTATNAVDFLEAGALAVGVGGWLFGDGAAAGVAERARALVAAVGPQGKR